MPRVIRLVLGLAVALTLVLPATAAAVAFEEGPRLSYVREGEPLQGEELLTADLLGERASRLVRFSDGGALMATSWSGDGTQLAVGTADSLAGLTFPRRPGIFTLPAGGGPRSWIQGTERGFEPVFSPDGATIALARARYGERQGRPPYFSVSTWVVVSSGGRPRQLTPWRDGLVALPSSFSPDGRRLVVDRQTPGESPQIVSLPVAGGRASLLVRNGLEAAYSPDGTAIAFVRLRPTGRFLRRPRFPVFGSDVYVAGLEGSRIERQLTFTPKRRETGPSWDPSGERLVFTQLPAKLTFEAQSGIGSSIIEINADGSCRHRLLFTYGLSYREAAWQPGPGREAGRIQC